MRLAFSFLLLVLLPLVSIAQPKATNFPNMLVYHQNDTDAYVEVLYTGKLKRLESKISKLFLDSLGKPCTITKEIKRTAYGPIFRPAYSGTAYTLNQDLVQIGKTGFLLRFRIPEKLGTISMLDLRIGVNRSLMATLQEAIDQSNKSSYYNSDQVPNTMYVYEPEEINKNLASYLFYYSKDPVDTSMKRLTEWFVLACEKQQNGTWIKDDVFRVDNLRQPAFGSSDTYSLTIEHSVVQDGYHQYVIYLSNYKAGDTENNYQVRPHDIHIRLWHYYNTLLLIEKLAR